MLVHEDFIGLHPIENTSSNTIVAVIKHGLIRMNLRLEDSRGQCYDGAAVMEGAKTGVKTKIKDINSKYFFTHWRGHLNLAVGDEKCQPIKRDF